MAIPNMLQSVVKAGSALGLGAMLALAAAGDASADFFDDVVEGVEDAYEDTTDYVDEKLGDDEAKSEAATGTGQPSQTEWKEPIDVSRIEIKMEVQDRLNLMGYDAGPVDGQPGVKTANAVAAFQRDRGMTADGKITSDLVYALRDAHNQQTSAAPATQTAKTAAPAKQEKKVAPAKQAEAKPTAVAAASTGKYPVDENVLRGQQEEFEAWCKDADNGRYERSYKISCGCLAESHYPNARQNVLEERIKAEKMMSDLHPCAADECLADNPSNQKAFKPVYNDVLFFMSDNLDLMRCADAEALAQEKLHDGYPSCADESCSCERSHFVDAFHAMKLNYFSGSRAQRTYMTQAVNACRK